MPLRDLLITLIVFGALPYILMRPHIGIYMWSWIGYMNPHRLSWGFAYNFPFAAIIGAVTLVSFFLSKEEKRLPLTGITILLILFNLWILLTTFFAIYPESAWSQWEKVFKIQFMAFITIMLMNNRDRIHNMVWVIAISLGFYGIKGGFFAIRTGGEYSVIGPEKTFIGGNTALALALIMVLPLLQYLQLNTESKWVRRGLVGAMLLTALAIVASYSRGAFLGVAAIALFLWLKSRYKLAVASVMVILIPVVLAFMPQKYYDRLATLQSIEENESAQGRFDAWAFATKMAIEKPLGGGFQSFTEENYHRFAPNIIRENQRYQDAHSIYFEVLGEHGFVGLALFLALGAVGWKAAGSIIKQTKEHKEDKWMADLAGMIQVSLIGYAVSGAFLGLAYFDFYYHLLAILVLLQDQLKQKQEIQVGRTSSIKSTVPQPGLPMRRGSGGG